MTEFTTLTKEAIVLPLQEAPPISPAFHNSIPTLTSAFAYIMAPHANDIPNGRGTSAISNELFTVRSPNVIYTEDAIKSTYTYRTTKVTRAGNKYVAEPLETVYDFNVEREVGKVGLMLVGWSGNNGTTVTAGIIANRDGLTWESREGIKTANYYGSVIMGSTIKLGSETETGKEIYIPFHDILPMVKPSDLVLGGWDISSMNLADAMDRAAVLEPDLKRQVKAEMKKMVPLPSVYYPDFIAANQEGRADNVLGGSKEDHVGKIRSDIR
jgi:myo-inositol-1-phosphate synthase